MAISSSQVYYIQQHRPLITPRIDFALAPRPELPIITPRIDFNPKQLSSRQRNVSADSENLAVMGLVEKSKADRLSDAAQNVRYRIISGRTPALDVQAQSNASSSSHTKGKGTRIPKPPGEPGRPKSGGFAIETELQKHGWSPGDVSIFMTEVREEARTQLDTSVSFRSQNQEIVQSICDLMSSDNKWPCLQSYDKCWPVKSALKLALKYQAEASRRNDAKRVTRRMQSALNGHSDAED